MERDKPVVPVLDVDKCTGCGACVTACPARALKVVDGKVRFVHLNCHYCAECEAACPTGALSCPFDIVWE